MSEIIAAAWSIDSQVSRTRATATGNVEEGYDIAFTTGEGHHGSVFLPLSRYTVDNVRSAIQAQADLLDAVGRLTSNG